MKSKYKFTSSRHIEGEGKISEPFFASCDVGVLGWRAFVTVACGAGAPICVLEELSLVQGIPRSEQ